MIKNSTSPLNELKEKIKYIHTNEDIQAIIGGLELKPKDSIITICGSGEQTFAISQYVRKVVSVDYDENAIKYAKLRRKLLLEKKYKLFFSSEPKQENSKLNETYFKEKGD